MKVYVAGKDIVRGKKVGKIVEKCSGEVTWPWWQDFDGTNAEPLGTPQIELEAVKASDILVYLFENDQLSAHYELGMALGIGKPVIAVHKDPKWFLTLPNVTVIPDDSKIEDILMEYLAKLQRQS